MRKILLLAFLFLNIATFWETAPVLGAGLKLIKSCGSVDLKAVGGSGLHVLSLWEKGGVSAVRADGTFTTVISNARPQKLSLKDNKEATRALAIALPTESQSILFDANSTAIAILLKDPKSFSNSAEVANFSKRVTEVESFRKLVIFLKNNLNNKSLDELLHDRECIVLLEECDREIFGFDGQSIRKSLYEAKDKLEKTL